MTRLGIKSKVLMTLLAVSIGSIAVVSTVSFFSSRDALSNSITDQLIAERETLVARIESDIETIAGQSSTLAEDRMIIEALTEFGVGWDQLEEAELSDAESGAVTEVYETFVGDLPDQTAEDTVELYEPSDAVRRYLQFQFIAEGETEDRSTLDSAEDGTFYSRAHERFHPALRNYIQEFGYYDLFLVDTDGNVLYTAEKEVDFATSLQTGPYQNSNLAQLVDDVLDDPEPGRVQFVDFDFYRPSLAAPASFVASPVTNPTTGANIGAVVLQLPVDEIDRVMTLEGEWEDKGLGLTGEAYLVGPDLTMRSQARQLEEDRAGYFVGLRNAGVDGSVITRIDLFDSSTLVQPVDTVPAREALSGETGTGVFDDYRGVPTLTTYTPLDVADLRWSMVVQIDVDEATAPILALQRDLLVATGIITVLLTALAMFVASRFTKPLTDYIEWADRLRGGAEGERLDSSRRDEYGQLATSLNVLADTSAEQSDALAHQTEANKALLFAMMPPAIAERVQAGETQIADEYPSVTIIDTRVAGFTDLTTHTDAAMAARVLNDLAYGIEEIMDRHGIERLKRVGPRFLSASGLLHPRLDHRRRGLDFAIEARHLLRDYATEHGLDISATSAVSSGAVEAGVIGRTNPLFEVWGTTVTAVELLADAADPEEIITTDDVADHLKEFHLFVPHEDIVVGTRRISGRRLMEADPEQAILIPSTADEV